MQARIDAVEGGSSAVGVAARLSQTSTVSALSRPGPVMPSGFATATSARRRRTSGPQARLAPPIFPARFGARAGVVGAALLARHGPIDDSTDA